jgi:hypothetical protein
LNTILNTYNYPANNKIAAPFMIMRMTQQIALNLLLKCYKI